MGTRMLGMGKVDSQSLACRLPSHRRSSDLLCRPASLKAYSVFLRERCIPSLPGFSFYIPSQPVDHPTRSLSHPGKYLRLVLDATKTAGCTFSWSQITRQHLWLVQKGLSKGHTRTILVGDTPIRVPLTASLSPLPHAFSGRRKRSSGMQSGREREKKLIVCMARLAASGFALAFPRPLSFSCKLRLGCIAVAQCKLWWCTPRLELLAGKRRQRWTLLALGLLSLLPLASHRIACIRF